MGRKAASWGLGEFISHSICIGYSTRCMIEKNDIMIDTKTGAFQIPLSPINNVTLKGAVAKTH
jgi:hypothetical protein